MELILISSNKLKVILTEAEMKKYKLDRDLDISGMSEKRHLGSLLDDIKKKSGFNTDSGSIYVELFESVCGGCEMFITRESHRLTPSKSGGRQKDIRKSIITYKFENASDVILASKRLALRDLTFESRLMADENGAFYLFLTFRDGFDADDNSLMFMDEYGVPVHTEYLRERLEEHGRSICDKDAVNILSKL